MKQNTSHCAKRGWATSPARLSGVAEGKEKGQGEEIMRSQPTWSPCSWTRVQSSSVIRDGLPPWWHTTDQELGCHAGKVMVNSRMSGNTPGVVSCFISQDWLLQTQTSSSKAFEDTSPLKEPQTSSCWKWNNLNELHAVSPSKIFYVMDWPWPAASHPPSHHLTLSPKQDGEKITRKIL